MEINLIYKAIIIVVNFIYLFSFSYPLTLNFKKTENKLRYFVIVQITNSIIIIYFDFTTPFEEMSPQWSPQSSCLSDRKCYTRFRYVTASKR